MNNKEKLANILMKILKREKYQVLWVLGQELYFLGNYYKGRKIHLMKYEDLVENPKKIL